MAEELVNKIEKLITDGNKEVLGKISNLDTKIDGVRHELKQEIGAVAKKVDGLDKKVDRLDKKIDTNTNALYGLLKDVKEDVKKVGDKLDAHMRQPAHA